MKRIDAPNIYGYELEIPGHTSKIKVIRHYQGEWHIHYEGAIGDGGSFQSVMKAARVMSVSMGKFYANLKNN